MEQVIDPLDPRPLTFRPVKLSHVLPPRGLRAGALAMPPAFGDSESDRLSLAHVVLEAWARRKKQRLRFQQIVREARELFLDERALDAGALDRTFDAVIAAVPHREYRDLGIDKVAALVSEGGLLADINSQNLTFFCCLTELVTSLIENFKRRQV